MSITILRPGQILKLKIKDLTVHLKGLSYNQKNEVTSMNVKKELNEMMMLTFKYSVHDIEGVVELDGSPLKFNKDENGHLLPGSVEDILLLPIRNEISLAISSIMYGSVDEIINPATGEKIEGIEVLLERQPKA